MMTQAMRLIDINNPNVPFVENLDVHEREMYDAVIESYLWAYLEADTYEQFKYMFNVYWKRNMHKYSRLYSKYITFTESMDIYRKEKYDRHRVETDTPNYTKETEYELGDTVELKHGRVLTHNRDLTNDTEQTQYDTQTVVDSSNLGGSETNAYSGKDITKRTGSNVETRTETGSGTNDHIDDSTTEVSMFDAERWKSWLETENVLNAFIDEFSPLFIPIINGY